MESLRSAADRNASTSFAEPPWKSNTLTVDTASQVRRPSGHSDLLSPGTAASAESGSSRGGRKNSACSALTDDTLVASGPPSPLSPTAADKGKQREQSFGPIEVTRTRSQDYGTIAFCPSPLPPLLVVDGTADVTPTLERESSTSPCHVGKAWRWQEAMRWDEEAQVAHYLGLQSSHRKILERCPVMRTDHNNRLLESAPVNRSWWRPERLDRKMVSPAYAVYAVAMLFFYLYGPRLAQNVFL